MKRGKFFTKAKQSAAVLLSAAMIVGMLPFWGTDVKAADNSPYVVSNGRMVYASSSVSGSDPAYAVDGTTGTRWESAWGNDTEWVYVDLGKVTEITGIKLYWEGAYAKSYQIQISDDEEQWKEIYQNPNGNGGNEEINETGRLRKKSGRGQKRQCFFTEGRMVDV